MNYYKDSLRRYKSHMRIRYNSLLICLIVVIILIPSGQVYGHGSESLDYKEYGWEYQSIGLQPKKSDLFYPDGYANYWKYSFKSSDLKENQALRIKGVFPIAKYMSYNIYNRENKVSLGSIYDIEMKTDNGKPITQGKSTYEVFVAHSKDNLPEDANVMIIPKGVDEVIVMLRYYYTSNGIYGGVDLPFIEAINTDDMKKVERPESIGNRIPVYAASTLSRFLTSFVFDSINTDGTLNSYRFDANSSNFGLLANFDNKYLITPMVLERNQVALIRFIPPTVAKNIYDTSADVRYWSLGMGENTTRTAKTYPYTDLKIAKDGYVYFAITPSKIKDDKVCEDINIVPWKAGKDLMLIYRNLLTREGYEYDIAKVEPFVLKIPVEGTPASETIGNRAPSGKIISVKEFLKLGKEAVWK